MKTRGTGDFMSRHVPDIMSDLPDIDLTLPDFGDLKIIMPVFDLSFLEDILIDMPDFDFSDMPDFSELDIEIFDFDLMGFRPVDLKDIIIDPGFGFGKTVEHNFALLSHLGDFQILGCPIMVGVSRKSMVNKVLGTTPNTALNGTTVLHTMALERGASILRVHDVREAVEAVKLVSRLGVSPRAPTPSRGTIN